MSMRRLRCLVVVLFCGLPILCSGQQRDAWLPITDRDKKVNEVPGMPGAGAVQLYYSEFINDNSDNDNAEWDYSRVKILTEAGKQNRDITTVKIIVPDGFHVRELKARTVHPDGSISDFSGKPFDKA